MSSILRTSCSAYIRDDTSLIDQYTQKKQRYYHKTCH